MKAKLTPRSISVLIISIMISSPLISQNILWEIGAFDRNYAEFALAEEGYSKFTNDGFFVVGSSEPANDWPYMHPGPNDNWAGGKAHSFAVIFGLSDEAGSGSCKLVINMVDTHNTSPGNIKISINGNSMSQALPPGGGDESIYGDPKKGRPYECIFNIPREYLKKGNNELEIIKDDGSWFLYDALRMEAPEGTGLAPVKEYISIEKISLEPGILKEKSRLYQNLAVDIVYAGPAKRKVILSDSFDHNILVELSPGNCRIINTVPEISNPEPYTCRILEGSSVITEYSDTLRPSGRKTIYILPHSHTDIGYTDIQTAIEDKQVENLKTGIQYAVETRKYPEGSRFVWNVEVGWAAGLYLNRLDRRDRKLFNKALKEGWISLNGMYLNELTGLCRPEELLRLFRYGTKLAKETGTLVDAAMISDVPGYTWGTVTAMAQAGIKYFSVAPNYFDRIGDILVQWENKPFYWVGPSGKEKVLVWIPYKGYAWSHTINELNEQHASAFLEQLDKMDYPYDIAYMRWSGHGDNAVPEKQISDFVKQWNEKYAWPRFIISSTGEAFRAFEEKYGDQLEEYAGDWTPYWEDGAGSSALETAMNRNTADRLTQAEALIAMGGGSDYPVEEFERAWEQTLLYSEHTWGAWCSITDPENEMTKEQWAIKKSYADEADRMSRELLNNNLVYLEGQEAVEVINTTGWPRSGLVRIEGYEEDNVKSAIREKGYSFPVQKLSDGSLVFFAEDIPAFSSVTFTLSGRTADTGDKLTAATISGNWALGNGIVQAHIDPLSGDLNSLTERNSKAEFADLSSGEALNQYLFFEGRDLAGIQTSGEAEIRVIEPGPLYAVIEVKSEAPGCNSLLRRYKLAAGNDYIEIENIVDKKRAPMPEEIRDWFLAQNENKESVNFAFPFNVEGGVMRLDLPIGSMIPWKDQIPSACKNWYSVGRYADISNNDKGISWFTLDAPLVEVGEISATLVGSQSDPSVWRKEVEPTQKLYSWAMNNHWGTNYRQYQEGPVTFRYALRPHDGYDAAETYRIATGFTQPLLVSSPGNTYRPPVHLEGEGLVLFSLKPADDGNGCIARLYNPGKNVRRGTIMADGQIWLSNTAEDKIRKIQPDIELDGMELLTVRIDR